ncbi:AAA family ATPase [Pseudomonas sp. ML96]|uniref:AAA family ATPase n=1 Tax=Pseudomonas sp. ML96 TaxID=1523503 RepID=UPI0005B91F5F|nr:AAA family ATPase [Pseudomonas sp. ML96]
MDAVTSTAPLCLNLLGRFSVAWRDQPLDGFNYDKMRALLAYLSLEHQREHSRETLAALLWESSPASTWRGNLRRTLSDLRRVLETPTGLELFDAGKNSLRFLPQGRIDALRFLQAPQHCAESPACQLCPSCIDELEEAAALYRGDFLAGLDLADCPDFEDWLLLQRESLRCHALALLEHLSNHFEQRGELQRALPHARRLVEIDPWQEGGQQRLMRLLALNGQSAAALSQYESFRNQLWKELGVHPSKECQALQQRIRQGELRPVPQAPEPRPVALPPPPAELRQVTVLYCEISTAASADPEEALALLAGPQAQCAQVIRAHGGYLVQAHGGGLLAYFGYPQAREDAARIAVLAALSLAAACEPAQVRCGLHTGQIVTAPGQQMPDATGFTSDLAIQVRQLAGYQEVTLSSATFRLVQGYFRCMPLQLCLLGSGASAGTIYRAEAASSARHRLAAQPQLTPLVGRDDELRQLLEHWQQVHEQQRGRALLLCGDPGVGKSRLVHELGRQLPSTLPGHQVELRCLQPHRSDPLYPCAELIRSLAGFAPGSSPEQRYQRLCEVLQVFALDAESRDLVADLLGLPLPADSPVRALPGDLWRERMLETLLSIVFANRQQPLLLVLEDAHWADSSTLQLFERLLRAPWQRPLLLLITARPEFAAQPWIAAGAHQLELPHLSPELARGMVSGLAEGLERHELQRILALADGVPLFIEELVQWAASEGTGQDIPLTLNDLLMARIDLLGGARATAQLAASIGREFHIELLEALHEGEPAQLHQHLKDLLHSGLVNPGMQSTLYQFKHALIHQAAYLSQTRAQRRRNHARIAEILRQRFPARAQHAPGQVAHHLGEAGLHAEAISHWQQASNNARRISANREAAECLQRALEYLAELPADSSRDRQELELQLALGTVLNSADGYGAATTLAAFARAHALGAQVDDPEVRFRTLFGIWGGAGSEQTHDHVRELGRQVLEAAQHTGRPVHLLIGQNCCLVGSFWGAPLRESRSLAEAMIACCEPQARLECLRDYGEDPLVNARNYLLLGLWVAGQAERAQAVCDELLSDVRVGGFANAVCYSLVFTSMLHFLRREPQQVLAMAAETIELCQRHGLQVWHDIADVMAGWARVAGGDASGMADIERGVAGNRQSMSSIEVTLGTLQLDALLRLGRYAELVQEAERLGEIAERRADRYLMPEVLRLRAEALLALGREGEMEPLLQHAEELAGYLGAGAWHLRLAMTRQRWQPTEENREALSRRVAELAASADPRDLADAEALLGR